MTPVRTPEARAADERAEADASDPPPPRDERPRSEPTFGRVIARRWWLVLGSAMLLMGVGLGIAVSREPNHTAETRLTVGSFEQGAQQVPGFVEAARQLASTYSRLAESDIILVPVAREFGTPLDDVKDRVRAAPVPESPVLRIETQGAAPGEALRLAELTRRRLQSYVASGQEATTRSGAALREFRLQSRSAVRLESRLEQLRQSRERNARSTSLNRIQDARAAAEVARLRAEGSKTAYLATQQRGQDAAGLSLLERPRRTDSDRLEVAQQLGFVGLLGGAIIGVALASLLGFRRSRAD